MKPLTSKQEWALAYACHHGSWTISGRGGMALSHGIEGRGLGTVQATMRNGGFAYVLEPTDAGRAYAAEHGLVVA